MNILIPHSWLLEHLETSAKPEEIQKYLSLSGPSVERIYEIEGEPVYDIEITTNRVDSMSVRGVAREAAVILTQAGLPSKLKPPTSLPAFMKKSSTQKNSTFPLPKIINDPKLTTRITCMVIADVAHTSSPLWMQTRLKQIGQNVHESIIDITNYITHDLGHPCHAFDYDRLMILGGVIKVVRAAKGKKFTTLDDVSYVTVGGEVVFENNKGEIIDFPGIKGTNNSGITINTKNVLLWIESIDPTLIRFGSMTHSIRTVAAQLNEKGVDPELMPLVFAKGIELFSSLASGKIVPESFLDLYPKKRKLASLELPLSRIEQYLGIVIEPQKIKAILESLGCVISLKVTQLKLTPPSWRPDIVIPEDVVEEIARIYGYHNLPSVLMNGAIPINRPEGTNFTLEQQAKALLASMGGYEVYTYSMISEPIAHLETKTPETTHVKLKNPLTEDMIYMRRTLWASHTDILKLQSPPFVFELANIYIPADTDAGSTLPIEELHLTLSSGKDERHLKGVLDALISSVYLPPVSYKVESKNETLIYASDIQLGRLLFKDNLTVIDLDWKIIVMTARKYPVVKSIPKVAPIIEDMTFIFPKPVFVQNIITAIKEVDPLIERVEFQNSFKRNLSFKIYYQPQEEMSATEIAPYRQKISEVLAERYAASIVGKL